MIYVVLVLLGYIDQVVGGLLKQWCELGLIKNLEYFLEIKFFFQGVRFVDFDWDTLQGRFKDGGLKEAEVSD